MKFKLVMAALALAASVPAMAKTENLGSLNPPDIAFFGNSFRSAQSFTDTFNFTVNEGTRAVGGLLEFDLSFGLGFDVQSVSLTGTGLSSPRVDTSPLTFSFGQLAAGAYSLIVSGIVTGAPANRFDIGGVSYGGTIATVSSSVAAPVPEPEALATLALGLGVVGFMARRRARHERV